ncbi:sulfotransferase [Shewanella sp. 10N.261.52.F9]|uniref:tetratricopeptide repeat-containing sulfotransferase family protein n=1 Tax=Shewanella sp. 10N.261.52.F9 TaxID=3229684 RepID=UPI00354F7B38
MSREEQYLKEAISFFASQQFSSSGIYARKVIRKNPDNLDALLLLAKLSMRQNDVGEAYKFYSKSLALSPNCQESLQGLASLAESKERFFEAFDYYQTLSSLLPSDLGIRFKLGMTALQNGNVSIAEQSLRECVDQEFVDKACLLNLAHVYKAKGDTDKAVQLYHQYILQAPEHQSTGYWSLADLKSYQMTEQDRNNIETYLAASNISLASRSLMLFALGRFWEQQQEFNKAYQSMTQANQLLSPARPFKKESFLHIIKSLKTYQANNSIDVAQSNKSQIPIFIVGMPRSGTTLVEQILASHSKVQATDELPYIERIALQLEMSGGYVKNLQALSTEMVSQMRQSYLKEVEPYLDEKAAYFIDKNPNNFLHIGLIKTLFPEAKIINVIRHTTDNAISVFKQHFSRGHDYSYSTEGIEIYWNAYHDIMQHWDRLYGEQLCHVSFETLVNDPETQIRRILDYCSLDFMQECIDFHQSKRTVLTPSAAQVRRPMNVKAIGMRDKYRQAMGKDYHVFEGIAAKVKQYYFR